MKSWIAYIAILTLTLSTTFGCSMCCGPYDYDYPNIGGKHQRVDPRYGRVGSILSDPNANAFGPSADSNLEPAPEPRSTTDNSDSESGGNDSDLDIDAELERLRKEADSLREEINPMGDGPKLDPGIDSDPEKLPSPDGPTASRNWRTKPLRPNQNTWR